MTDEAFIRAIATAPGDDAPRLVYADWLDKRQKAPLRPSTMGIEWIENPGSRP